MYTSLLVLLGAALSSSVRAAPAPAPQQEDPPNQVLAGAPISNITVDPGQLVQCAETTISWTGAVPPSTLQIATGGLYLPTTVLSTIPNLPNADGSYTWRVTQPEGTGMFFQLTDSQGQVGYVQNVDVKSGDGGCLAASASASASGSGSASVSGSATSAIARPSTPLSISSIESSASSSAASSAPASSSSAASSSTSEAASSVVSSASSVSSSSASTSSSSAAASSSSTTEQGSAVIVTVTSSAPSESAASQAQTDSVPVVTITQDMTTSSDGQSATVIPVTITTTSASRQAASSAQASTSGTVQQGGTSGAERSAAVSTIAMAALGAVGAMIVLQ